MAFKLRFQHFHTDDGGEAFANIFAPQIGIFFLQEVSAAGKIVDHSGQRRFKSGFVGAALLGVDIVGIGENIFGIAVIVLNGKFRFKIFPFDAVMNGFM